MTAGLRLHKLHGLGNDFLVALVDAQPAAADASRTAAALCDRRRGVGADGLIYAVLDPAGGSGDRSAAMRLWNSDGSPAEISGNGLRCLAHAISVNIGSAALDIVVQTVAGSRRCSIRSTGTPGTVIGTTEMGTLSPGPQPDRLSRSPEAALELVLEPGAIKRWTTLDVGNPHAVISVTDPAEVPLHPAGPAVEAIFSGGINVHFGAVTGPDQVTLAVWERGSGATEACGTGAVAAASAFCGWGEVGQNVTVRMTGGEAQVDLSAPVTLTGESVYVAAVEAAHV
jgi:diaminopimelate epimerase